MSKTNVVDKKDICNWLKQKLEILACGANVDINFDEPIINYGIDSLQSINISGELENWLKLDVEPTLLWDNPTINKIADHLIKQISM